MANMCKEVVGMSLLLPLVSFFFVFFFFYSLAMLAKRV